MKTSRKKIVAANWKMNKTLTEAIDFSTEFKNSVIPENVLSIIAPPALYIKTLTERLAGSKTSIAAQDCSANTKGAFTGEISAGMIQSCGAEYIIIGHSERRTYHKETNALIRQKIRQTIDSGLSPIFCIGETLEERNANKHFEIITSQIKEGLSEFNEKELAKLVIAYEPVWAIGTGVTATTVQAEEIHAFIRKLMSEKFGAAFSENISILYGGSCNPANAKELFASPNIDGGLIGGASLNAKDFTVILNSFA